MPDIRISIDIVTGSLEPTNEHVNGHNWDTAKVVFQLFTVFVAFCGLHIRALAVAPFGGEDFLCATCGIR